MIGEFALIMSAFATLSEAVKQGAESFHSVKDAGKIIGGLFDAEDSLRKKVEDEKHKVWGDMAEWEHFQQLEQVKQKHRAFREEMIWTGHADLYVSFMTMRAENKRKKKEQEKAELREHNKRMVKLQKIYKIFFGVIAGVFTVISFGWIGWTIWGNTR